MALNVKVATISAPASNGGTTVLSGLTDPQAVIVTGVQGLTSDQIVSGINAGKALGFATKYGGAIQQATVGWTSNDAAASSVVANTSHTARCLRILSNATPTVGLDMQVAAAGDWTTSQITFTFPTTTSGWQIHVLVLGGSTWTAQCGTMSLGTTANVDVALTAGFGRPDAVVFLGSGRTVNDANTAGSTGLAFGSNHQNGDKGYIAMGEDNAANTMLLGAWSGDRGIAAPTSSTALRLAGSLDATVGNWPTDGFRFVQSTVNSASTSVIPFLALKGIQIKCGRTTARTTTGTTSITTTFTPKAIMWAHAASAGAADTNDSAGALLATFSNGFKDLVTGDTRHDYAGSDDAQGTSITFSKNVNVNNGTTEFLGDLQTLAHGATTPTKEGHALLTANGSNVDFDWSSDAASLAVNIAYIIFGEVAASTFTKTGIGIIDNLGGGADQNIFVERANQVIAPFTGSGADVFSATETGAGISPFTALGGKIRERAKTGLGISPFTVLGSAIRERTFAKTGIAISNNFIASGVDSFTPTETGIGISPLSASGADVMQSAETGAGVSPFTVLGSNANIFSETGAAASPFVASGADTATSSETGAGISERVASAADVFTASETGSGISPFTALGADSAQRAETGIGIAAFVASGGSEFIYSESGVGISPFVASGAKLRELPRTGAGTAVFTGSGADAFIGAETGAGIAVFSGSGTKILVGQPIIYTKSGLAIMPLTAQGADATVFSELGTAFSIFTGSGADQATRARTGAGVSVFTGSGLSQVSRTAIKTGLGISPRVAFGADVFNANRTGAGIIVMTGGGIVIPPGGGVPALIFPLAVDIAPHISQANIDLITYTVNVNDTLATIAGVEDISANSANLTDVVYLVEISEGNYVAVLIDQTTLANLEWTTD